MVRWPNRLEKQLRTERKQSAAKVKAEITTALAEEPSALGVNLIVAASNVGRDAERALLDGKKKGWQLLAATRRMRAYSSLLSPSATSSGTSSVALAILEALQWNELTTAKTLGTFLQKTFIGGKKVWRGGYWGSFDWKATATESELEALAFHLLSLRVPRFKRDPRVTARIVDLDDFAGAAGLKPMPSDGAFEAAFYSFWDWCEDETGCIPRGARLSASPVFACLRVRKEVGQLSAKQVDEILKISPEPFAGFLDHLGAPIENTFAGVLEKCRAVVKQEGFEVD